MAYVSCIPVLIYLLYSVVSSTHCGRIFNRRYIFANWNNPFKRVRVADEIKLKVGELFNLPYVELLLSFDASFYIIKLAFQLNENSYENYSFNVFVIFKRVIISNFRIESAIQIVV